MLFSIIDAIFSEEERDPIEVAYDALPYLMNAAYEADEEERYRRSFEEDDER